MKEQVPFNAQERDIDLLLLEETSVNPDFLSWLVQRFGIKSAVLVNAQHSVFSAAGETDVLVLVDTESGRIALMIEDKIGAAMQPRQAERYKERGTALVRDGFCTAFQTALCAPTAYLQRTPIDAWDATVSFEELAAWFELTSDARSIWRRDLLIRAGKRQLRTSLNIGSTPPASDSRLQDFKTTYYRYASIRYPEFTFTLQTGRDQEYYFSAASFPKHIRLKHRFSSAVILVFENIWMPRAEQLLPKQLPDNVWIESGHASTLHLVTGTEPMDWTQPADQQLDLIDSAMSGARRLMPFAFLISESAR